MNIAIFICINSTISGSAITDSVGIFFLLFQVSGLGIPFGSRWILTGQSTFSVLILNLTYSWRISFT